MFIKLFERFLILIESLQSVKTNIGHLGGCAGLAELLKTILSVERGVIFPSLNFEKLNPRLLLDDWRLAVPKTLTPWPTKGLRRASVNSFGYGGKLHFSPRERRVLLTYVQDQIHIALLTMHFIILSRVV